MPIPKPNKSESREEYMSRCVEVLISKGLTRQKALNEASKEWNNHQQMLLRAEYKEKAMLNSKVIRK